MGSPRVLADSEPRPGLMVVFGAGASYDCIDATSASDQHLSYRPPLGAELFQDRNVFKGARDLYPAANNLLAELAAAAETVGIEKHPRGPNQQVDR
jgi:hypothetical protein